MRRLFLATIVFVLLSSLVGCTTLSSLPAQRPETSRYLTRASLAGPWLEGELLVGYRNEEALQHVATLLNAQIEEKIERLRVARLRLPTGFRVAHALAKLRETKIDGLRYIEPNYLRERIAPHLTPTTSPENRVQTLTPSLSLEGRGRGAGERSQRLSSSVNDPLRPKQYALDLMKAEEAWERATGQGVVIAIVDTGLDGLHPDLMDKQVPGMDCYTGRLILPNTDSSQGEDAHATHVAGIAAAWANDHFGIAGVAYDVKIMPIQIFNAQLVDNYNRSGYVGDDKVAACLIWAALIGPDGRERSGDEAQVLNNSWGGRGYSQTLKDAIDLVLESGAVFINSMGNSGVDEILYPKNYPGVIGVGATNARDKKSDFSTMGAAISVSAPGELVLSAIPRWVEETGTGKPKLYEYFDGTSMAAPQVSGAAALLKELLPNVTPYQIRKILERTADDLEERGFDNKTGWGRVNLARAVQTTALPQDGGVALIRVITKNRADTNRDGTITDEDEQVGIPAVDVILRQKNFDRYFSQTDFAGTARLGAIDPGTYEVIVSGGDAAWYGYRLANRVSARGQITVEHERTSELTLELTTTLEVTLRWQGDVDLDLNLNILEFHPGLGYRWVGPKRDSLKGRWGIFSSDSGAAQQAYTLSEEHYPSEKYLIAINARNANSSAIAYIEITQNGQTETYGPYEIKPGQFLVSAEWSDWWENAPNPDFELPPGPGGPWVY